MGGIPLPSQEAHYNGLQEPEASDGKGRQLQVDWRVAIHNIYIYVCVCYRCGYMMIYVCLLDVYFIYLYHECHAVTTTPTPLSISTPLVSPAS